MSRHLIMLCPHCSKEISLEIRVQKQKQTKESRARNKLMEKSLREKKE